MNERSSRKGLVIAVVALVVVLAGAAAAYNALSESARAAGPMAAEQEAPAAAMDVSDAAAPGDADAAAPGDAPDASPANSLPRLADYDCIVYTADDQPMALSNISYGRPMVLNFWATWCPYCIDEMDDYQALFDEYGSRIAFAFIDVADGQRETVEAAAAWLADNGHESLPAYYDTSLNATYTFGAQNLPTTVIVAQDGTILANGAGRIDAQQMRQTLEQLLG